MKLKAKLPARSIVADERGQALVEFILVTPVIIFFFFALLQFLLIIFTTQLSNYAVYAAARVYCVQHAADADEAVKSGELAAALVMAPVASLAAGELPAWAGFLEDIINITDGFDLPESLEDVLVLGEGYALARYWRSDVEFSGPSGDPQEIGVTMEYLHPVIVPGFSLLWNMMSGPTLDEEYDDNDGYLKRKRLVDIPTHDLLPQSIKDAIDVLSGLITFPLPYVEIHAKCSMGYEPWNGSKIVLEDGNSSDEETGEEPEGLVEYQECTEELEPLRLDEGTKAEALEQAEIDYDIAQADYDTKLAAKNACQAIAPPQDCSAQIAASNAALTERNTKKTIMDNAEEAYEDAKDLREEKAAECEEKAGEAGGGHSFD